MGKYNRETTLLSGTFSTAVTDAMEIAHLDTLAALLGTFSGSGNVAGAMIAARDAGYRLTDIQAVTGYRLADLQSTAESLGIPAFSGGTPYVNSDGLAYLHEGEAVMPARAAERWRDGGESSALLSQSLALIDKKLAEIEANTRATATHAYNTMRYTRQITDRGVAIDQSILPFAPPIKVTVVA